VLPRAVYIAEPLPPSQQLERLLSTWACTETQPSSPVSCCAVRFRLLKVRLGSAWTDLLFRTSFAAQRHLQIRPLSTSRKFHAEHALVNIQTFCECGQNLPIYTVLLGALFETLSAHKRFW